MNDREKVEQKIAAAVSRWEMLPAGCTVVAGFSGGADSVALLHFLSNFAKEYHVRLIAAHVNHGLRGAEADSDEAFVSDFCRERDIELKILRADVRALAERNAQGLEECGRAVRYSFFQEICRENSFNGTGRIATAHTLSDSAETVLLNLAKGAGTKGLSGIPPVRGNIVRPLIGITREEVETYCACYHLSYVTDSSNLSDEFARNRIRHMVVPVLKEINPQFGAAVSKTVELLRCDEEYFASEAGKLLDGAVFGNGYSIAALREAPRAVLLRSVPMLLEKTARSRLSFDNILAVEEIIRAGSGSVTVAGGIQCFANGNTLSVACRSGGEKPPWRVPLSLPETRLPDGRVLCIRPIPPEKLEIRDKINNLFFHNQINYDTILITNSYARNRQSGDRFRPAGRGLTKTLKKLLNEAKVPQEQRSRLLVLQSGEQILWIEGFGPSEEARVTEETKVAAEILIKEC